MADKSEKLIIGLTEQVTLYGEKDKKIVIARIDTGATKSSIDVTLAAQLKVGPILKTKLVKSASGSTLRPLVQAKIFIAGKIMLAEFTIADRSHMRYDLLIGQNILKEGFLVDCARQVD